MARELKKYQLVERSITKKYRHEIWNQFIEAIKEYKLVEKDDTVCVVINDNAQSILIAKLFQHLKRISEIPFNVVFKADKSYEELNIPTQPNPTGYNKIASTECMSDVIEETLDSILHKGEIKSILPMEDSIIRPLFCINRKDIAAFVRYNELVLDVLPATRTETALLLEKLEKENKGICHSIFRSIHSLSLDTMIGYNHNGEYHNYIYTYQ